MDEGRSGQYDRAATWLGYVKAAYGASGRDAQWQAYIAEVRETHRSQVQADEGTEVPMKL